MENAIYIGLSRQMAMRRQMDVIANNLANMNTTAFKGERVLFEEYLVKPAIREKFSFVQDYGVLRDTSAGPLTPTGNPLDVAIDGKGYLVVDTPDGRRYSRNGSLQLDDTGRLVTADGHAVLDAAGRPIQLDSRDGPVEIGHDGSISTAAAGVVGRIDLVQFENEQMLRSAGTGLYATDETPQPATEARLAQGMVEGSNVKPIVEMTTMIELLRNYQTTQRMLDTDHERIRRSIERLAKVG